MCAVSRLEPRRVLHVEDKGVQRQPVQVKVGDVVHLATSVVINTARYHVSRVSQQLVHHA